MSSVKESIKKFFDVDLPISGGDGQSIDDPIIIYCDGNPAPMEYRIIGYIQELGNKAWSVGKQELIKQEGKSIDKVSIVLEDDPENYHNYYFDITQPFNI